MCGVCSLVDSPLGVRGSHFPVPLPPRRGRRHLPYPEIRRPLGRVGSGAVTEWSCDSIVVETAERMLAGVFVVLRAAEIHLAVALIRTRAELFGEARHARLATLLDDATNPRDIARPRAGARLAADDDPM